MKKILTATVLGVLVVGLTVPILVSAQEGPKDCCTLKAAIKYAGTTYTKGNIVGPKNPTNSWCASWVGKAEYKETEDWATICLLATITSATNWVFYILSLIVVIMIIWGGFSYMTAAGDPEKAGKGKTIIVYALIGLAIALFARLIPGIVKAIIGA